MILVDFLPAKRDRSWDLRGRSESPMRGEVCARTHRPSAMLRLYHELGFRGPIRVDHVPSMAGEEDLPHGYALLGRLFAVGYMKDILDTAGIPYR